MSNVNSPFWTSSIGLPKTYSIILFECLVGEESMTKNGDFGQNRQNWSTSNACRIAGTNNAFRFFSLKTYIYHSWTKNKFIWKIFAGGYPLKKFPSDHGVIADFQTEFYGESEKKTQLLSMGTLKNDQYVS